MDIDARVQAENAKDSLEAQLRESQKMEAMGRLAGGIAHDFNNILAVILSNSEMARSFSGQANPQLSHCVEEIQAASERARELVKQLLAFCRRQATNRKSIALAPVLTDCIRFLRSTIPARIDLSFTNAPAVPNVLADVMQIEQVVINLVNNAVQSMQGKPGSVRIHLIRQQALRNLQMLDRTGDLPKINFPQLRIPANSCGLRFPTMVLG